MHSLSTIARALSTAAATALLAGCVSGPGIARNDLYAQQAQMMKDVNASLENSRLQQEMATNPDLPAWRDARDKMALSVGDRVFDKSFDRSFDSMIVALANLGCRVNNMERTSGFITASLPQLPPDQQEALRAEAVAEYAQIKGFPASATKGGAYDYDMGGMMERMGAGLTLTMVRQGDQRTKIKLRFDNVYYPRTVQELYTRVWAEVDRQIFLDRSLD